MRVVRDRSSLPELRPDSSPIRENFREYLDQLIRDGYSVRHDEHGSDPDLIDPGGNPIETWREDYPYDERMDRDEYEEQKYQLQIELLKFQYWAQDTGGRARDLVRGPGRGRQGRHDQAVHGAPEPAGRASRRADQADRDRARPVVLPPLRQHLPTAGEIVLFDRSWYNRAGVERVMGFCSDRDYFQFLRHAPQFEEMLVESGFSLTKLWFSVTQAEQRTRFAIRQIDPVRRWKLSPMDIKSLDRWDAYTEAKETMMLTTDTDFAPWTTIKSNDKKRARINAMRFFLSQFDYEDKDAEIVYPPDPKIVERGRDSID